MPYPVTVCKQYVHFNKKWFGNKTCEFIPEANQSYATTYIHIYIYIYKRNYYDSKLAVWPLSPQQYFSCVINHRPGREYVIGFSLYLTWPQCLVRPETGYRRIRSVNDMMKYKQCSKRKKRSASTPAPYLFICIFIYFYSTLQKMLFLSCLQTKYLNSQIKKDFLDK